MKKKLVAGLLSITVVASFLTGCGSSATSTDASAAPASEASAASTSPAASEAASTETASTTANGTTGASHTVAPATTSGDYDASGDPAVTLRFTSVSVTGDSHTTAMDAFAEKVEELSGGSVTCKTYSDGTLFSADTEWDALTGGQADLAYISFPTLATQSGLEWCSMIVMHTSSPGPSTSGT